MSDRYDERSHRECVVVAMAPEIYGLPQSEAFAGSPGNTGRTFPAAVLREQTSVWSGSDKMMFGLPEKQPAT